MKTAKLIDVLTSSINAVCETNEMASKAKLELNKHGYAVHSEGGLWTSLHTLQSGATATFRALYEELPESLQTERAIELLSQLYPHKHEADRYKSMTPIARELHTIVFDLWNEMNESKKKFDF